jgi:hypothetical protein
MLYRPTLAALVASFACATVASADYVTVATYDEATQTNAVDDFAAPASGSEAAVIGDATEYAAYVAAVAVDHAAGFGGVVNFDNGSNELTDGDGATFTATYAGGAKSIVIDPTIDNVALGVNLTAQTPISGGNLLRGNQPGTGGIVFNLGAITGGDVGEVVDSFAITMTSRLSVNRGTVTATATFSDSTTAVATSVPAAGNGTDDTFYGFLAPTGESIQSVRFDIGGVSTTNVGFDDLAFTTVPEPGSLALLAAGGLILARRRR